MSISPASLAARYQRMELFNSVPAAILEQLAAQSAITEMPADAVVFHKDEPGDSLYLILKGGVKVHDENYTVARLSDDSCFGELALLDEGPRSMSVTTTMPTTLAAIEREVLFRVFANNPEVTRKIVSTLTQRLRYQTDRVVEHLRRREEELTRLVDERTAELNRQKEEAEFLRAKAETEKQEAEYQRQRAEQSERLEQQFLANMSHEIRTPMNAVMGMTNILLQKNPREDQLKYLESIRSSSQALLVILNDILDISKIEAGRLELEYTDLSVAQTLGQVHNTLQFRAEEKGLLFSVECDPAIPPVLIGDPVRLQQILLNLAGNAVKFTEKGSVLVSAQLIEQQKDTCHLRFEVRDTGPGMAPEQAARAFESFRQASADITRKYGGTGLGLSISKQLAELFGGTIDLRSRPGEGSVFGVTISLKISEKQAMLLPETASPVPVEALRGLRILVAEDNHYNRIVAVETLELMLPDVYIATVENGREAFEAVQKDEFDLVLMDVSMPEMDGLEATRAIRALPAPLNELPVVAFTASVTKAEIQKCEASGMNACVPKPFKQNELMDAIHAVVRKSGSNRDFPNLVQSLENLRQGSLDFLEALTGGNRERMRKYVGLYLESVRTSLPRIEVASGSNDSEGLRRAVHTLKPQFKIVGLSAAAALAESIERQLLEGGEPALLAAETGQLLAAIHRSCEVFENYLRQ